MNKTRNTTRIGVQEFNYTGEHWRKELLLDVCSARLAADRDPLERGLAGMYHATRADGSYFVAEPHSALLADLATLLGPPAYREPDRVPLATAGGFDAQPRSVVRCWKDAWYRCAVHEEGAG